MPEAASVARVRRPLGRSETTEKEKQMPNFTLVNLRDVEDVAGERAPGIEGRFARKHMDSTELGVSYFRYSPNLRSPMAHSHREQEEAYVVVEGSGRVKLDDEIVELSKWDILRVAPEVVRAFEAGPEGLALIAIGGTRPGDGDGVPIMGWWTD
jgi:mannose-6-phosphate isomerase-like protein (cupin superfamily)